MEPTSAYLDSLRPAGSKRSGKRDLIVNVFLRQEGHLTADDLYDLIRREDQKISRATVYRTLQWMEEAGIARKVDFGEGRFRFEHSYRHPRHFHLICKTCNRTFEFLSSDIEALLEEVAAARNFTPRQSILQIHGTCESCRTGRAPAAEGGTTELLFARDALRIAIATERSGLEFYSRGARMTKDARGRRVFEKLAGEEKEHLGKLEARYKELLQQDPPARVAADLPVFQGRGQRLVRGRRGTAREGRGRPAGADDRHPLRARLAPLLQALRRPLRRLGRQTDLPRVRHRRARTPRAADSRVSRPARAAAEGPARKTAQVPPSSRVRLIGFPRPVLSP